MLTPCITTPKVSHHSLKPHTKKKKKNRKKHNIPPLPHRQEFLASGNINITLSLELILICFKTAISMSTERESHCFYTMCDTRRGKRMQVFTFSSLMHKNIIFFFLETEDQPAPDDQEWISKITLFKGRREQPMRKGQIWKSHTKHMTCDISKTYYIISYTSPVQWSQWQKKRKINVLHSKCEAKYVRHTDQL